MDQTRAIWLIGGVASGTYIAFHTMEIVIAIRLIFVGFFMWISYGPVLGVLCKK